MSKKILALLCSLLLVVAAMPLTALTAAGGTDGGSSDSTVVWSLDMSQLSDTSGNSEYLGIGGYQPGIQLADTKSSSFSVSSTVYGTAVAINPSGGTYKAINIQTGTAVKGTNYYTNNGFVAEAGRTYTVTFNAYVADGSGQVRVRGNQATDTATNGTWSSTNISTEPTPVSYTWVQDAAGGNMQIDTGSTAQGTIVYLTDLQITTPKPIVVWSLDMSQLSDTSGNSEYLGIGGYQPGIQLADTKTSSFSVSSTVYGTAVAINPSGGTYKAINIQTGTAVKGTNYYTNNGFVPVAGKTYNITFNAYVADGSGQVRVRGNQSTDTAANGTWSSTNISTEPTPVSYTWVQDAAGGNMQIDTGSTAQGTIVYLTDLQITDLQITAGVGGSTTPPSDEVVTAFDLQQDAGLVDIMTNGGTEYLQRAGGPTLTPISNAGGKESLGISKRANDWDGVDVKADKLGLVKDADYSVELAGHIPEGVTIPIGSKIVLKYSDGSEIKSVDAAEDFTLSAEGVWGADDNLRVTASAALTDFVIDSLIVKVKGGIKMPSKPLSNIPGVVIASTSNGDAYTGATIVLGTDKSVWPYATNSQDQSPVVAFVPEEDATYHLTFNVTSNGTQGFRVRWYNDVGFDPHTADDALHVNDNVYKADQVATKVPAYFQNTIAKGETKDYAVDFTMSGSAVADGLVGNIGIRGQSGVHDFTINSLKITDDNGNVLVDWLNTDDPIPPDDYVWPAPKWNLTLPSLKDAYSNYFLIGNILGWGGNAGATPWGQENDQQDPALKDPSIISQTEAMFKAQYNVVTPENVMKPDNISKAKDTYDYTAADKLVAWAKANNIAVHGHTLIWYSQSPAWLNKGDAANRVDAKANLEGYIANVAGHFKGEVISWDVVNEAFGDDTSKFDGKDWTTGLRKDSPWYIAYANGADASKGESGADYIYDAFVAARLADPGARLYYNDYNETYKYEEIAQMAEALNAKWATDPRNTDKTRKLLEGIGMQSHFWVGQNPDVDATEVETAIQRFIQAGVRISVSELDIPFAGNNNYHLDEEEQAYQAQLYGTLFEIYKKYAANIDRVTFWGKADIQSWRGSGMPVLFDNSYRPKAAFYAVLNAAKDGGSTGSGGGSGTQPADNNGPVTIKPTVKTENGRAIGTIDNDTLNKALAQAAPAADGKKQVVIELPQQANATSYEVQLPAASLKSQDAFELVLKTDNGTISVPSNMLSNVTNSAENVSVRIAKADTSSLSADVRAQIGNRPVIDLNVLAGDQVIAWNNPVAPVTVAIPYTPTAAELANPDQIVIWTIDSQGNATSIPNGHYDAATGTVQFSTTHFSTYAVAYVDKTFSDLQSVPWAQQAVEAMAARGIISGTSEDSFAPKASIKRADFIKLLVKALELKGSGSEDAMFGDVPASAYYYDELAIAKELGIATGYGDNTFKPDSTISRQDMMVLTARALAAAGKQVGAGGSLNAFADAGDVSGYAKDSAAQLVGLGIVNGKNGKIAPNDSFTRAEAAVILYRIWKL